MDYERCEEERRGCINLAEHRCVSFTERYRFKPITEIEADCLLIISFCFLGKRLMNPIFSTH